MGDFNCLTLAQIPDLVLCGTKRYLCRFYILVLRDAHKDFTCLGKVGNDGRVFLSLHAAKEVHHRQALRGKGFKHKEALVVILLFGPCSVHPVTIIQRGESEKDDVLVLQPVTG